MDISRKARFWVRTALGELRRREVVRVGARGGSIPIPRKLGHFHLDTLDPAQKRWAWPRHIDANATPWLRALRGLYEHPLSFPFSLSPQAGLLLHALVLNHRPSVCIETGSNIGISSIWIAGALVELGRGSLFCFDDFEPIVRDGWPVLSPNERRDVFRHAIDAAQVGGRVRVFEGDSAVEIPRHRDDLRESGQTRGGSAKVQLAFIDGDHRFAGVLADFLAIEPMLETGGVVVLHDTFPYVCGWRGPRRLLNELHRHVHGTYETVDLYLAPVNYGMAIVRRVG